MFNLFLLCLLAMSVMVFQRVRVIFRQYKCPGEETIRDYFYGKLKKRDPEKYELVVAHLGICEDCQNLLHSIENSDNVDIDRHLIDPDGQ
ncbi:MAG: hypothetical protein AAF990_02865 [Bacteroidota bacterium]